MAVCPPARMTVCMSACLHRRQAAYLRGNLSAWLVRRSGDIRLPSGDDPELDPPTSCIPDNLLASLLVCLLASSASDGLTLRRSSLWLHAQRHPWSAVVCRGQALKHLETPSPATLPSDYHALPGSPSRRDHTLLQSPRFQGARPLWSRLKRRPVGPGAGMQSADQPPTPDAILSPHRLSGFRTRAPLRRSGNRPVRTVGRNGGVWYMMRNDCKTHVMMQCHAHA